MNKNLAIAIPTYNRAEILEENLRLMLPQIQKFAIPIYISDDSTNERTELIVKQIQREYPYIFYYKNNPALGHDHNCLYTLSLPSQSYIWYLGDSMIIQNDGVEKILTVIESQNPDFICFKEENRNIDIKNKIFSSSQEVLKELGWHLTMSGVTVYKKSNLKLMDFPVEQFRNFPQLAIIFYFFEENHSKLVWLNEKLIVGNVNKKSYWSKEVFSVFFNDLKLVLTNFPQRFSKADINAVLRDHSTKSKLFGYHSMVLMRISNVFNYQSYKLYHKKLKQYTNQNTFFLIFLSVFSKWLLAFFYEIVKRKINHKKKSK